MDGLLSFVSRWTARTCDERMAICWRRAGRARAAIDCRKTGCERVMVMPMLCIKKGEMVEEKRVKGKRKQ